MRTLIPPGGGRSGEAIDIDTDPEENGAEAGPSRGAPPKRREQGPDARLGLMIGFWFNQHYSQSRSVSYTQLQSMQRGMHADDVVIGWCISLVAKRASNPANGGVVWTACLIPGEFQSQARIVDAIPGTKKGGLPHYRLDELDCVLLVVAGGGHFSLAALCHPSMAPSIRYVLLWTTTTCTTGVAMLQQCTGADNLLRRLRAEDESIDLVPTIRWFDSRSRVGGHKAAEVYDDCVRWVQRHTGYAVADIKEHVDFIPVRPLR